MLSISSRCLILLKENERVAGFQLTESPIGHLGRNEQTVLPDYWRQSALAVRPPRTQKPDSPVACGKESQGIGDNIDLVRYLEPGVGFSNTVARLVGADRGPTVLPGPVRSGQILPRRRGMRTGRPGGQARDEERIGDRAG